MSSVLDRSFNYMSDVWESVDTSAKEAPWWLVLLGGVSVGVASVRLWVDYKHRGAVHKRLYAWLLHLIVPRIAGGEKAMQEVKQEIQKMVHISDTRSDWLTELPEEGRSPAEILADFERYARFMDGGRLPRPVPDFENGAVSGAIFNRESDPVERELLKEVFARSAYSNPLWPNCYPETRRFEAEVVRMTANLLGGDASVCGIMTSGGSMSILQSVHSFATKARNAGILFPEMIMAVTAHAAFYKAADLFRVNTRLIEVDDTDFVLCPKRVKSAINSNTALIVGSMPNYPYGTCDDIVALGAVAAAANVPLHVDACCGGFLLPFFDQDDAVPAFDFRVPGVTAISADTHKYGLCPKGSSVLLFKDEYLRLNSFWRLTGWCGGIYASPSMEGSRNGSAIALTWAALNYHGKEAFREAAGHVRRVTRELREKIGALDGMEILGYPDVCIVAWRNTKVCDYKLLDLLEADGFTVSPLQFPKGAHTMVTPLHSAPGYSDRLADSMARAIAKLLSQPELETKGAAAMYGQTIICPDRALVDQIADTYLTVLYEYPPVESTAAVPQVVRRAALRAAVANDVAVDEDDVLLVE